MAEAAAAPAVPAPPVVDPAATPAVPAAAEVSPVLGPDGQPVVKSELSEPAKAEAKTEAPAVAAFDPAKLTLPSGLKADDPALASLGALVGDDKLSPQERAQKLIDLYAGEVKKAGEASTLAWTNQNTEWVKQVKADADIGGAKFEATKTTIAKAIDSLGAAQAAAFREALDVTGAGNHPAVWKALAKFASAFVEAGHVSGNPPGQKPTMKEAFYPNSPDMK